MRNCSPDRRPKRLRLTARRLLVYGLLALAVLIAVATSARAREAAPRIAPDLARESFDDSWSRELDLRLDRSLESEWRSLLRRPGDDETQVLGVAQGEAAWSLLPAPAQRSWHAAVHDPVRDRMIVLGGEDWWAGIDYGDAWALALGEEPAWHDLDPQGTTPGLLSGHSAVYDPVGDRILVFGGGTDLWSLTLSDPVTWSHVAAAGTPPAIRRGHSAVIDAVRNRMIVFGGWSGGPLGDLWELSLSGPPTWSEIVAGPGPAGRDHHSAIVDPADDRMIVYGGWNDRPDVWQLSLETQSWAELTTDGALPAGRWAHTAVLDASGPRMIVFGGESSGASNETWALSLAETPAWSPLSPVGPPPIKRLGHVAVFDPTRGRMVSFGGEDWDNLPLRDVWTLDLAGVPAWGEWLPAGAAPAGRLSPSLVLDPARDRIVMFGGESGGYRNDGGAGNSTTHSVLTLALDGASSWMLESPAGVTPSARLDHVALIDPLRDRMIVHGGAANRWAGGMGDVWTLGLGDMTWTQLAPGGTAPGPLRGHTATYDPLRDRVIVFGGAASASGAASSDVWALALDGDATWSLVLPSGPSPTPRRGHSAVYDLNGDRLLVFGGLSSTGEKLADVWALSLDGVPEWTPLAPAGTPPSGRSGHTAILDPGHDRIVIHGGLTTVGPSSEVWMLTLGGSPEWSVVETADAPPPRSEHVAVQDLERNRMVVFGGWDGEFVLRNDVWVLEWGSPSSLAVAEPQSGFMLLGARPNPFRAGGRIAFELPRAADVSLEVFDVRGRRVATLARGLEPAGHHEIAWAASGIPAGVYFLSLRSGSIAERRRLVVVR